VIGGRRGVRWRWQGWQSGGVVKSAAHEQKPTETYRIIIIIIIKIVHKVHKKTTHNYTVDK